MGRPRTRASSRGRRRLAHRNMRRGGARGGALAVLATSCDASRRQGAETVELLRVEEALRIAAPQDLVPRVVQEELVDCVIGAVVRRAAHQIHSDHCDAAGTTAATFAAAAALGRDLARWQAILRVDAKPHRPNGHRSPLASNTRR